MGSDSKGAGHEIGVFEHVVPNVYAEHWPLTPRQEPQQFIYNPNTILQERVAGHDPDAGSGMKLAGHIWVDD